MAVFHFKRFSIDDSGCGMKLCSDSVMLGAWARIEQASTVLDLGCGSGVLALMAAQRCPHGRILAIDVSPEACRAARLNADASPWAERICVECADALAYSPDVPVDAIICNPPYFSTALKSPDSLRALARHGSGLSPYSAIELAAEWLAPDGALSMIVAAEGWQQLLYHAELKRMRLRREVRMADRASKSPSRLLLEFRKSQGQTERGHLFLRTPEGGYTDEYQDLTSPFYLDKKFLK